MPVLRRGRSTHFRLRPRLPRRSKVRLKDLRWERSLNPSFPQTMNESGWMGRTARGSLPAGTGGRATPKRPLFVSGKRARTTCMLCGEWITQRSLRPCHIGNSTRLRRVIPGQRSSASLLEALPGRALWQRPPPAPPPEGHKKSIKDKPRGWDFFFTLFKMKTEISSNGRTTCCAFLIQVLTDFQPAVYGSAVCPP